MRESSYQVKFMQLCSSFPPQLRWVLCEDCGVLTRRDSTSGGKWMEAHGRCTQHRFLAERPEGRYNLLLSPMEGLAALGEAQDE